MAVCDLAMNGDGRPVSLAEIAERQDISLSYLEQLFAKLRRAGVVKSVRGPGGGYLPARELSDITIASVVAAVDGEEGPRVCRPTMPEACAKSKHRCATHDLWEQLGNQVRWFLNRVSVADVISGNVPGAVGVGANNLGARLMAAD